MRRTTFMGASGITLEAEVAETRRDRMRGLRDRRWLPPGEALLIPNARSVHTVGMRYPIEVAFLDADFVVLAVRRVPPWRLVLPRRRAKHILECAAGWAPEPGDRLRADG